jgi:DNA gyrase/topoisomerase IV subunit B
MGMFCMATSLDVIGMWHRRQGKRYEQSFARGRPLKDLESTKLPKDEATKTGTQVRFLFDPDVFVKK